MSITYNVNYCVYEKTDNRDELYCYDKETLHDETCNYYKNVEFYINHGILYFKGDEYNVIKIRDIDNFWDYIDVFVPPDNISILREIYSDESIVKFTSLKIKKKLFGFKVIKSDKNVTIDLYNERLKNLIKKECSNLRYNQSQNLIVSYIKKGLYAQTDITNFEMISSNFNIVLPNKEIIPK